MKTSFIGQGYLFIWIFLAPQLDAVTEPGRHCHIEYRALSVGSAKGLGEGDLI